MTTSPNPGGQNRRLVRTVVAEWLTSAGIPGLDHVFRAQPTEKALDEYHQQGTDYACILWPRMPDDDEGRVSLTGPASPTGKAIDYTMQLVMWHRSYQPGEIDWADDEDDFDRLVDAVKDAIRGVGRNFGRPEVILTSGEGDSAQRPIHGDYDGPVLAGAGAVDRMMTLRFEITQVI